MAGREDEGGKKAMWWKLEWAAEGQGRKQLDGLSVGWPSPRGLAKGTRQARRARAGRAHTRGRERSGV